MFASWAGLLVVVLTTADPEDSPGSLPSTLPEVAATTRGQAANAAELLGGAPSAQRPFTIGGYAEVFYQWNFNDPSNGITNLRGFDNRHNTFTIANAAIDAQWDYKNVIGRLTLQIGHTPSTYYLAEPSLSGSSATGASDANLWKYIQQAYVGYRFAMLGDLTVQAGLFLSPIGPEGMAIKDNWNWSRSNLFFGLPYYHTGLKLTYPLSDAWSVTLAGYNGWNSVVDNNAEKSISAQATYTVPDTLALSLLYFGGVERATGAPEGRPWRHDFDAHLTYKVLPWLEVLGHLNGGFEPNTFGVSAWVAAAGYLRFRLIEELYFVVRGDFFHEWAPRGAASIFWPVAWMSEGTATLDFRPHSQISFRLEYRHDHAAGNVFFAKRVAGDGSAAAPFVFNRNYQDTVTLGLTGWF